MLSLKDKDSVFKTTTIPLLNKLRFSDGSTLERKVETEVQSLNGKYIINDYRYPLLFISTLKAITRTICLPQEMRRKL